MTAWMSYLVVVTLVLGVAALLAERVARQRHMNTRWIWTLAMWASLVLPLVVSTVSIELPGAYSSSVPQRSMALRDATLVHLPAQVWGLPVMQASGAVGDADRPLKLLWLGASATVLGVLGLGVALVARRRRSWEKTRLGQTPVYVATDMGPAVVGLMRPRIVVPAWLLQAPRPQQDLVLAHEQSHLDACDPQLLGISLCLLVAMPWNLPLWWQLMRLRRAMEVDCDLRILRRGHTLAEYGEALLAVGQRQSTFIGAVAAMSESRSFLEQRISIMLNKPTRWARTGGAALAGLSLALLAVAAELSPPNAVGSTGAPAQALTLDARELAKYEGYYRLGEHQVMQVRRDGQRLFVQVTGQSALEVFASSHTEFFARAVNARGSIVLDAQGRAIALVWHQNGQDITMPRMDEAAANQVNDALNARLQRQTALPGTEAALRRLIVQIRQDPPRLEGIDAGLAAAIKAQHGGMQAMFAKLGEVKSLEFAGVSNNGWDKYLVRYEHGTATWQISINGNGVIDGALVSP